MPDGCRRRRDAGDPARECGQDKHHQGPPGLGHEPDVQGPVIDTCVAATEATVGWGVNATFTLVPLTVTGPPAPTLAFEPLTSTTRSALFAHPAATPVMVTDVTAPADVAYVTPTPSLSHEGTVDCPPPSPSALIPPRVAADPKTAALRSNPESATEMIRPGEANIFIALQVLLRGDSAADDDVHARDGLGQR